MKNKFKVLVVCFLIVCFYLNFAACTIIVTPENQTPQKEVPDAPATLSDEELYANAVRDAVFIEDDEILPLVNITKEDENVKWDGEKVLVAFMNKYPDSYPAGEDIQLKWGNVCFAKTAY